MITAALDAYIASTEEERPLDGKWHPSSMFFCDRAAVLGIRMLEPTNKPDAQAKRRFRLGHMIHEMVQASLPLGVGVVGVWIEFEVEIPEFNIRGHGDALIEVTCEHPEHEGREFWVVEIKSTRKAGFKFGMKDDHFKQAKVYAVAAKKYGVTKTPVPLGDKLAGIIVCYIEKEDLLTAEHVIKYDSEWEHELLDKVGELESFRNTDDLPEPLPMNRGKAAWQYDYCPYKGSGKCCFDKATDQEEVTHW